VIVCAYSALSRRDEAKNVATLGDARTTEVIGRSEANEAVSRAVAVASEEGATVAAALLLEGDAAATLIKTAQDRKAQLIVVGARHDRSFAERLLGTVAAEVTKKATCDVLVVRPEKA
jgi:nucleotide-binding universal stress UspA family protein